MKIKAAIFLLSILIFSIFTVYVHAAGGGGSPGGSSGGSTGGNGVERPVFSSVSCDDQGIIYLQMKQKEDIITAINDESGKSVIVKGSWDFDNNFKSDKEFFPSSGNFSITNSIGVTRTFTCPGLHECFSIKIENIFCKKSSSGIESGFSLIGETDYSNLTFNFKLGKNTLRYSKKTKNAALRDLIIKKDIDGFKLNLNTTLNLEIFEVLHEACLGKNYVYSSIECSISNSTKIDPNSLKCGGLLNIRDRVKCRISLESEFEEYQNFFPEECRNHNNPEKCLQIYRNVSECWDLSTSKERISCLKEKINLKNELCNNIECKLNLNEKLKTMIKLRFYNLEEQAEILEENGLLIEEDLVNFVIEIEKSKLVFNDATNKEEMRDIIRNVQENWSKLMIKVKRIK